ncbi:hypothetical protein FE633_17615 [Streptomyces montanus]|uniref:Uncharacterized protein n=1 Tax=Streptomyces montanus TaxID=2580423 RepID=A0A5R9FQK8_9ACTN|nr:hypothetical protein [Streptomyces montanus]TLS44959.1 hypothetical protein FE633_17615 [Streptomyces montanus]
MAARASRPEDAPRGCRTQREGRWAFKRRYRSEQEIPAKLGEDASTSWYWCEESCGAIHVGHTRMGEWENRRGDADSVIALDRRRPREAQLLGVFAFSTSGDCPNSVLAPAFSA